MRSESYIIITTLFSFIALVWLGVADALTTTDQIRARAK